MTLKFFIKNKLTIFIIFFSIFMFLLIAMDFYSLYLHYSQCEKKFFNKLQVFKNISINGTIHFFFWLFVGIFAFFSFQRYKDKIFYINSLIIVLLSLKMIFTSNFFHIDRYSFGIYLPSLLFLFIPPLLIFAKNKVQIFISFVSIFIGYIVLIKVNSVEGLFFFTLAGILTVFLLKKNKKLFYFSTPILMGFFVFSLIKINKFWSYRKDDYLDKILIDLYQKHINFFPKIDSLFSIKNICDVWFDFVPILLFEQFGWILGTLILIVPFCIFIYGLVLSYKNYKNKYSKIVFILSIVLLFYSLISLLPLIPNTLKYGLYYPMYGYITGSLIMWIYLIFLNMLESDINKNDVKKC